jgi:nucleolar GTP-binding protein
VNNYPFTTRGLTIGHMDICWQHYDDDDDDNGSSNNKIAIPYEGDALVKHRCQVMDSPGVLNRVDRNAMELLTVAAMQHLPTAVCFVVDLSKTAVSTIPDQLAVRQTIRARFPKRPWLDVATKADVEFDPDGEQEWRRLCDDQGIVISIEQDIGVEELSAAIADCLGQVQLVLAAMTALKESNGGE